MFFSGITKADIVSVSDKVFFVDITASSIGAIFSPPYLPAFMCLGHRHAGQEINLITVHGSVMSNNKKYYLPRSMCVAVAIKYNERKVLEARSKF